MSVIVEPKIIVPDIELEINEQDEYAAERVMEAFGPILPVVKFNDYVLSAGEIKDYEFNVSINRLPYFRMTIIDTNFAIRKLLSDDTFDTVVIFLGNKIWYHKYEGIVLKVISDAGDEDITIEGCIYIPKLFESLQKHYNNQSIKDVLSDIANTTDIGLYVYDNDTLDNTLSDNLNPNKRNLDFAKYCISNFTNNIWCIDNFYFMHVGDIDVIRDKPIDTYFIKNGKKFDNEQPIVITTNRLVDDVDISAYQDNPELDSKLVAKFYSINSNIGAIHLENTKTYKLFDSANNEKDLDVVDNIGVGDSKENTFDRFFDRFMPYYKSIVNKKLTGKSISLEMSDVLYEIVPFQNVDVEIFFPRDGNDVNPAIENIKDEANSGKKTIIGYKLSYNTVSTDNRNPNIQQTIEVI